MWRTPEELITVGLATQPVVTVNEGHNGLARCPRTRVVGRRMVRAAQRAGCRFLAMEALPNPGPGPSLHRTRPAAPEQSYLSQPEMVELIDTALDLGWALVGYEADLGRRPPGLNGDTLSWDVTNWREAEQAANLASAVTELTGGESMLVWLGADHGRKLPGDVFRPMGHRLGTDHGVDHFAIDQLETVSLAPGIGPRVPLTAELASVLDARGGTAGFVAGSAPAGHTVPPGYDAALLSTDNVVVGDLPPPPPGGWLRKG